MLRYDASVRHGVRALGEIDPSPDFRRRLRRASGDRGIPPGAESGARAAGIAAALMLAAAVALLVYSGSDSVTPPVAQPAAVAEAPSSPAPEPATCLSAGVVNPGVPFVTFSDLSISPFREVGATTGAEFHVHSDIPLGVWGEPPALAGAALVSAFNGGAHIEAV